MARKHLSCGRDLFCIPELSATLETAGHCGFEFICAPLVHPRYKRDHSVCPNRDEPLTRSDLTLTSGDWSSLVVGKVSPWIQPDSPVAAVRTNSEKALLEELTFSSHLNVPAVLVSLSSRNCMNLSRCLMTHLNKHSNSVFWVSVPMVDPAIELEEEGAQVEDTWEWWNQLRTLCSNSNSLGLVLEMGNSIPEYHTIQRWFAEPFKAVVVPTSIFIPNKSGYPVLSRSHQGLLQEMFQYEVQVILRGVAEVEYGLVSYYQYLNHLYQSRPPLDTMDQFAKGYNDYLQSPLQPLMDNLDSNTYEIFEKDPVKYITYQKAVAEALKDRIPDDKKEDIVSVVMVVGAGRGPLVKATLQAASKTERLVRVYAVEKNPGAIVTLRNRKAEEWGNVVTVVSCDMREWKAPELADILVSELLGSFSDNELSPECLDGAQRFLKPDGISIPCSYTSHIAPVMSSKLYAEVEECKMKGKSFLLANYETPYVVKLWNACLLSSPQECFTFHHPNYNKPIDNDRHVRLKFTTFNQAAILHGFAGYFYTVLYRDITLSIVPETHSKGMISWFPIYFPIKESQYVPASSTVELLMWRVGDGKKVWYEWAVTCPQITPIHNPNGRSYWIGL